MRFPRYLVMFTILLFSVGALAACGSSDKNDKPTKESTPLPTEVSNNAGIQQGEYRTLTIDEFAAIVENQADQYQIINVHIPYAGEVANTDANIPYNDLAALMAAIPDKNTPVILYCRSGNMSEQASTALIEQGYTQVWDVPGGMHAWQASGRKLVDK